MFWRHLRLNETLRRALLKARIDEEDVAARLDVDPKTVRRWLEGRVPYLRHRWALASLLGLDEADLWPEVRTARSRPQEVSAIYPSLDAVPRNVWLSLLASAEHQIDVLADEAMIPPEDPEILACLTNQVRAGATVRICLRDPGTAIEANTSRGLQVTLNRYRQLAQHARAEIRLHRITLTSMIYRADGEFLISHRAFGVSARRAPVLHLHQISSGDMTAVYLQSFGSIWAQARHIY
jgi:transcriptional regulator with XRE-family HTH domain